MANLKMPAGFGDKTWKLCFFGGRHCISCSNKAVDLKMLFNSFPDNHNFVLQANTWGLTLTSHSLPLPMLIDIT